MNIIKTIPESKDHWLALRAGNINSTEISALFDCNPYLSQFQIFHNKRNGVEIPFEETDRIKWGTRLQSKIAEGIAADRCWSIREMKEYIYDENLRLGSSFDYIVNEEIIMEIKNIDSLVYRNKWTEDEAPPAIELQVQQQMLLSGKNKAVICALVGGNEVKIIERDYNPVIGNAIIKKVKEFWLREDEPQINYDIDSNFLKTFYQDVEQGKIIESNQAMDDLASAYQSVSEQIKELEARKEEYKLRLMSLIGNSEKVKSPFYSISCSMTQESRIEFVRKPFRNFRISWKKNNET